MLPKDNLGTLNEQNEPNEVQMNFAGPLTSNNTNNNYTLVTVDRLSRYPSAESFNNCDAETAIEFYTAKIPRSIRCQQAQAFKSRI